MLRPSVAGVFRQEGMVVREHFGVVESFEKTSSGVRMTFSKEGERESVEAAIAVVATGWIADTVGLNLAAAGIESDHRGFVKVEKDPADFNAAHLRRRRCHGTSMLVPAAIEDGFVAATNAVLGPTIPLVEGAQTTAGFTDPEYARAGLTEAEARDQYDALTVVVHFDSTMRTIIDGCKTGFCKLIVDRKTAKILGCHVVGERAVEIAQVAAIAMSAGVRVDELMQIPLAFPTYTGNLVYAAAAAARQLDLARGECGWRWFKRWTLGIARTLSCRSQEMSMAIPILLLSILFFSGIANAQPAPTATDTLRGVVPAAAPDGQSNLPGASLATSARQETNNTNSETFKDPTARVFELVLPSEHVFGDWGGLRSKLQESGITPRLILVTDLAGNPSGGRSQAATAPSSVELSLFFDLEKIYGVKGAPSLRRFRTAGATASRRSISGTPSAHSRSLASRHTASLMSLISRSCSTTASSFASGASQRWMTFSSRVQLRVHAERVLRKPVRNLIQCTGHERVLRHLGGSREGEA